MRLTGKERSAGYAVAALGCALATTVIAAPAASATAGGYCGTYGDGYTTDTVWTKQPPGCVDFNLTWVATSGNYKGYYWSNSNGWNPCAATVWHQGGSTYDQVLCSNVATGTALYVARTDDPNIDWHVHVNY